MTPKPRPLRMSDVTEKNNFWDFDFFDQFKAIEITQIAVVIFRHQQ